MKVENGRAAVWEHAAEANLQDAIKLVAAYFDIADIAIHTPGKLTYLHERPVPPKHRVRPFESDVIMNNSTGELIAKDKV